MSVAETYRRLAGSFDATAADVRNWAAPSPCAGWTAADVIDHLASSQADVVTRVGLSIERTVEPSTDPLGAWREVRDGMQAILDDPAKAMLRYESLGAETTFAATIGRYFCFDLIIHRWDLAAADRRSVAIDAADIADANAFLDETGHLIYDYGASAPAVSVADDASEQDKLLARRPRCSLDAG